MKVCNQFRLLEKDGKGLYIKDGAKKEIRRRTIISDESIKNSNSESIYTGLIYEIDEKETALRNSKLKKNKTVTTK